MATTSGIGIMLFCIITILFVTLQSYQVDGRSITSKDNEIQTSKGSNQLHETTRSLYSRVKRNVLRRKQMSSSQGQCDTGNEEYKKIAYKSKGLQNQITKWENTTYEKV